MRDTISGAPRIAAPTMVWAGGIGLLLLGAVALEWAAPPPAFSNLPPLALPSPASATESPLAIAAAARDVVLARPLFATLRRPLPVIGARQTTTAAVDRIAGIIAVGSFDPEATAIMQPKDGGKPLTLRVGDRFQGRSIIAIDAAGLTLDDGTRVRPQFSAVAVPSSAVLAVPAKKAPSSLAPASRFHPRRDVPPRAPSAMPEPPNFSPIRAPR